MPSGQPCERELTVAEPDDGRRDGDRIAVPEELDGDGVDAMGFTLGHVEGESYRGRAGGEVFVSLTSGTA